MSNTINVVCREAMDGLISQGLPALSMVSTNEDRVNLLIVDVYRVIFYFAEQINQIKASLAEVRIVNEKELLEYVPNNIVQDNFTEVLCGVSGLADYLGCGKNKAQAIISSRILIDKGIQYKAGRGVSKERSWMP